MFHAFTYRIVSRKQPWPWERLGSRFLRLHRCPLEASPKPRYMQSLHGFRCFLHGSYLYSKSGLRSLLEDGAAAGRYLPKEPFSLRERRSRHVQVVVFGAL